MGWIVHRQALLYAEEFGFDERFEGLVAQIVAEFVREHDPVMERCWIAEREGDVLGSVFLCRQTDEIAKLRLLYVEKAARGLGVGFALTAECIRTATDLGYRRLTLWTNDVHAGARRLYQRLGFKLVASNPHHSFGHELMGEDWELELGG